MLLSYCLSSPSISKDSNLDKSAMEGTGEEHDGADAENGDALHVPLQDDQLEEEKDDDDDADADVPAAAAGAEDALPGGVLPKLAASDYGTNSPTSKGAQRTSFMGAHGATSSASRSRASARCSGQTARVSFEK